MPQVGPPPDVDLESGVQDDDAIGAGEGGLARCGSDDRGALSGEVVLEVGFGRRTSARAAEFDDERLHGAVSP
ncbi:hypothetical protein GCM10027063_36830 [Promicromonospora xylanilytica]